MISQAQIQQQLLALLQHIDPSIQVQDSLYHASSLGVMVILAFITFKLAQWLFHGRLHIMVSRTKNTWDDELQKHGFFRRCGHLIPAILTYLVAPLLLIDAELLLSVVQKLMLIYIIMSVVWASSALFNTIEDVYNASNLAKRAPITGFIQVAKLAVVIVAGLLIVSSLLEKSPLLLLSGFGAVTAILLLLFRDTILGFVAGIQIAANRMVNTGDWIELPKYGADGEVLQVGLTTVKVQNWDKTISTVPTYSLISDSVKNWRGMTESGGRRIKRSLRIDIKSIQFCDQEMIEEFKQVRYIKAYIAEKMAKLQAYHSEQNIDQTDLVNSRRLTNIGTFRAYVNAYIENHPSINKDMTMMVRQLPPTETGLPIEIYCFSADKNWVNYEGIQADIFDHCLAMLPIFGLRAYQRVSDTDIH